MGLGKTFTKTVKSTKDFDQTYEACIKLVKDSGLKLKSESKTASTFEIHGAEPMKWLTTNWPNKITFRGEIFDGMVLVKLNATSNGASVTQDNNISRFLDNISDSLSAYIN